MIGMSNRQRGGIGELQPNAGFEIELLVTSQRFDEFVRMFHKDAVHFDSPHVFLDLKLQQALTKQNQNQNNHDQQDKKRCLDNYQLLCVRYVLDHVHLYSASQLEGQQLGLLGILWRHVRAALFHISTQRAVYGLNEREIQMAMKHPMPYAYISNHLQYKTQVSLSLSLSLYVYTMIITL